MWLRRRCLIRSGRSFEPYEVVDMDNPRIDEIARRLLESVPPGLRALQQDLESNFRAILRASLSKLDLVARDEFDAQMRVLERTRARLEELERRVAAMQAGTEPGSVGHTDPAGPADSDPAGPSYSGGAQARKPTPD